MPEADSNSPDPGEPSLKDVARVAALSRLALDESELEAARRDLAAILAHASALSDLDVEDVAPMPRPHDMVNRLAEDEPGPVLDRRVLLDLAPATEGEFIAVPKVLGEGGA